MPEKRLLVLLTVLVISAGGTSCRKPSPGAAPALRGAGTEVSGQEAGRAPAPHLETAAVTTDVRQVDGEEPCEAPQAVVTYNAGLARNYVPFVDERLEAMLPALASLDADVLCLQEVWEDDDARRIQEGLAEFYPHAFRVATTPAEDSSSAASCSESELAPLVACVGSHCRGASDVRGCVLKSCGGQFFTVSTQCRSCLAANVSKPLPEVVSACTSPAGNRWSYDGRNGLLLLSRKPFLETSHKVLESFLLQRAVLHATVEFRGRPVGVFCTHLSTPIREVGYGGTHGSYRGEHAAQVDAVSAWVKGKSGKHPAILLGDLNCGPENREWDVVAEFPDHFATLLATSFRSPFAEQHGQCTFCGADLLGAGDEKPKLIDHILFYRFGREALHPERVLEEPVPIPLGASRRVRVPMSDHYGVRVEFTVPAVGED